MEQGIAIEKAFSLFVSLVVLSFARAYAETKPPLKIGVMLCLTGVCAETGSNSFRGLELASERINRLGGILGRQILLEVQDTKEGEGPQGTISAFKKLSLEKEITFFIGPTWSTGGVPLIPLIQRREDIIVISPSLGVREFHESSDRIFNLWPHDEISAQVLARRARRNL